MTNGEKYKTAQERYDAFLAWCDQHGANCHKDADFCALKCAKCQFAWLDLEAEEEKPLPCPFCGGKTRVSDEGHNATLYHVYCAYGCGYYASDSGTKEEAIAAHNRVAKMCREGKE